MKKVLIIGLGLIGGSYAKALTKNGHFVVDGVDTDKVTSVQAKAINVVRSTYEHLNEVEETHAVILLALNPEKIISLLKKEREYFSKKNHEVCDIASLQVVIIEALFPLLVQWGISYVSLHPIAGRKKMAFQWRNQHFFKGRAVYIQMLQQVKNNLIWY